MEDVISGSHCGDFRLSKGLIYLLHGMQHPVSHHHHKYMLEGGWLGLTILIELIRQEISNKN